jgi:hypothetical protein
MIALTAIDLKPGAVAVLHRDPTADVGRDLEHLIKSNNYP